MAASSSSSSAGDEDIRPAVLPDVAP
jgi:hypothetical protein